MKTGYRPWICNNANTWTNLLLILRLMSGYDLFVIWSCLCDICPNKQYKRRKTILVLHLPISYTFCEVQNFLIQGVWGRRCGGIVDRKQRSRRQFWQAKMYIQLENGALGRFCKNLEISKMKANIFFNSVEFSGIVWYDINWVVGVYPARKY